MAAQLCVKMALLLCAVLVVFQRGRKRKSQGCGSPGLLGGQDLADRSTSSLVRYCIARGGVRGPHRGGGEAHRRKPPGWRTMPPARGCYPPLVRTRGDAPAGTVSSSTLPSSKAAPPSWPAVILSPSSSQASSAATAGSNSVATLATVALDDCNPTCSSQ